jgi:Spy/CpxP family protein refolding chaperone
MSRTTLWFGLMVLFLAGALTGAVGTSLYYQYADEHRWDNGPAGRQERIMKRLTQELSLTSSQQAEIHPIVKRAHLEILRVRVDHQPDVDRILGSGMDEIKTKLSPEQQSKLGQLYAQLQRRWQLAREYLQETQESMRRKE